MSDRVLYYTSLAMVKFFLSPYLRERSNKTMERYLILVICPSSQEDMTFCLFLFVYLPVCLSVCLSYSCYSSLVPRGFNYLSICLSVCLSDKLFYQTTLYYKELSDKVLYFFLVVSSLYNRKYSLGLSVCLSYFSYSSLVPRQFVCLSVCLSIYLSLSVCLSVFFSLFIPRSKTKRS